MNQTLKSVIDTIKSVSLATSQVETCLIGESIDLAALNFDNKPVLVWIEGPMRLQFTPGKASAQVQISMRVLDQVISDGVDILEIQSKCDMVAQLIMDDLNFNHQDVFTFTDTSDRGTFTHTGATLANHSGQKWAGVRYDFTIEYIRAISACEV